MEKLKRFFRRLWLGVRGTSRPVLILALCAVLSAGALGIYLLAAPSPATGGGTSLLFPAVDRKGIQQILIHNDSGVEYTVKSEYGKDENGNVTENLAFWLEKGGISAALDSEKLSYLVVGTGRNSVYDPVISAPEAGEEDYEEKLALYEQKKKEFGFTERSPYYELTKREDGTTLRVYYGKTALSGDGYYVMLEGRETVYVTATAFVGDLLYMKGPETLLSPVLYVPSMFQYAYAYPKHYQVYDTERVTLAGTPVSADYSSVWFTYLAEDGKKTVKDSILLSNATDADGKEVVPDGLTLAIREYLVGKSIGVFGDPEKPETLPEPFTYTYPDDEKDEALRGKTVSFTVISVDALETEALRFEIEWNPARRERELLIMALEEEKSKAEGNRLAALEAQIAELENSLVGLPTYLFRAPDGLKPYLPETATAMSILENTLEATGTVVRMGMTGDVIDELGLYAHRISFSYPFSSDYLEGSFLPGEILVSGRTKDGTRYVGSLLMDMVLEVDAATFDFLDEDLIYFTDATLQTAPLREVETMTFYWNYGEEGTLLHGTYTFEIEMGIEENAQGEAYETVVAVHVTDPSGTRTKIKHKSFNQLFYRLAYARYAGEHTLTEEEVADLVASSQNRALGIYYTMRDGTVRFFEFYPISDGETGNSVLVRTKNSDDGGVGEIFTVYGTTLKDIARGFLTVITGGDLTAADRYS